MSPSLRVLGNLNGGTSSDSGDSSGGGDKATDYLKYIHAEDGTHSIEVNLPNFVTKISFEQDKKLTSFNGDLSSVTYGYKMFYNCSALTSINSNFSSITNGESLCDRCTSLTSFNASLSSLPNGMYAFNECKALTSLNTDLSGLTDGRWMFGSSILNCAKLDLPSVQNIATTINDLASQGKTGSITIGMAKSIQGNADLETALATIRSKGWTVSEMYA